MRLVLNGHHLITGKEIHAEFTRQGGEHVPRKGAAITYSDGHTRAGGYVEAVHYDYTQPELWVTVDVRVTSVGGGG